MTSRFLANEELPSLLRALTSLGYEIIGPQVKDGAIVFDVLEDVKALPWGWQETASPGSYQLEPTSANRCFNYNTGPQGIKPWLFKPQQTVWTATPTEKGFQFTQAPDNARPLAVIGLRACDLAALSLQDKHFIHGAHPDPWYQSQRQQLLIIAVNCSRSADTCFCVSTGDGPQATYGYDVLLDELDEGYLVQTKSDKGEAILGALDTADASAQQHEQVLQQHQQARTQQRRLPESAALRNLLHHLDDNQWLDIARRCLACGNCTSVCPTCFCSRQESQGDAGLSELSQVRYWDSCFSEQHGFIAGKRIRAEISQRYRQWMIHKLVTWQDQFGRSGCTGCGRCISWCPVGIDLVEEVRLLLGETAGE